MAALTAGQLRARVSAIRKKNKNGASVFALRVPEVWSGPDRLDIDGIEHLVIPCVSDLHAREVLLRAAAEGKPAVLLCPGGSEQFGEDVLARFAKHRVIGVETAEILSECFSARVVDPRVLSARPLVKALLDRAPAGGYRPAAGGILDLQHAWTSLIEQLLGAPIDAPSLSQLLQWSGDPDRVKTLCQLDPELKQAFVDWFARGRGDSVRFMMAAIDNGVGSDLVPLGLALGLVFSPEMEKQPEYHAARGRLEKYFGGQGISHECAQAWYRCAEALVRPLVEGPSAQTRRDVLRRVDALLADLKLVAFAHLSDHSPLGLSGRLDRLGEALQAAIKGASSAQLDAARACIEHARRHSLASSETARIERAEMALRLISWLKTASPPESGAGIPELMEFFHREGGFLDWARNRLRETDVSKPLQEAFAGILAQVDGLLLMAEKAFAERLSEWTKTGQQSGRVIPIEDLLSKVVIPTAKEQPVLLLVLDGMSVGVFRQLLSDIDRFAWSEIRSVGLGLPRPVLAAIPPVTQISRRALFLGRLDSGKSGTEKAEFGANNLLHHGSGSQVRPKLFLKGDLVDEGSGTLANDLRAAIADKRCRVVGVVVNAIDDHLDSGDQVLFTWGLERIRPLPELLKVAADADRVIVLTSDHGHVLDFGTKQLDVPEGEAGDRYLLGAGAAREGEIVFEGTRVESALGHKKVVLAWSGGVRYSTKKRGYHGGASPQEMVVPLAILKSSGAPTMPGWEELPSFEPDWWRIAAAEPVAAIVPQKPEPAKRKPVAPAKEMDLFAHAEKAGAATATPWVEALLNSEIYQEQLKLAVRGAPSPELVRALVTHIDGRGGSTPKPALAQALGVPLFRVDGLIQNLTRILNVDGYEVLSFDRPSDTVTLNTKLLKTQFEIA